MCMQDHFQLLKTLRIPIGNSTAAPAAEMSQTPAAKARRFAAKNHVTAKEAQYYLAGHDYDEAAAQAEYDADEAELNGGVGKGGSGAVSVAVGVPLTSSSDASQDPADTVDAAVVAARGDISYATPVL